MIPLLLALSLVLCTDVLSTEASSAQQSKAPTAPDMEIAARFAPVLYQALGDRPRSDYITNFDFDGDWQGDNNWLHADDRKFPLKAFVYYSVVETTTHYFIHYAAFHPRDYKGGERRGPILSELIREGAKRGGKFDPTGLADEAVLAHENDMEGCLVVVKKNGNDLAEARIAFVETLQHNNFNRYLAGEGSQDFTSVTLDGQRPLLYVEPKGHGIAAFTGDAKQTAKKDFLRYVFAGNAEDPSEKNSVCRDLENQECYESVGYDLLSISTTLWTKVKAAPNATYGETCDFGEVTLSILTGKRATEKGIKVGKVGCAFLGKVGGYNMARPPWAWFDKEERNQPLGRWFFDPAAAVKRDFGLDDSFSTTYLRLPFWAAS